MNIGPSSHCLHQDQHESNGTGLSASNSRIIYRASGSASTFVVSIKAFVDRLEHLSRFCRADLESASWLQGRISVSGMSRGR